MRRAAPSVFAVVLVSLLHGCTSSPLPAEENYGAEVEGTPQAKQEAAGDADDLLDSTANEDLRSGSPSTQSIKEASQNACESALQEATTHLALERIQREAYFATRGTRQRAAVAATARDLCGNEVRQLGGPAATPGDTVVDLTTVLWWDHYESILKNESVDLIEVGVGWVDTVDTIRFEDQMHALEMFITSTNVGAPDDEAIWALVRFWSREVFALTIDPALLEVNPTLYFTWLSPEVDWSASTPDLVVDINGGSEAHHCPGDFIHRTAERETTYAEFTEHCVRLILAVPE